MSKEISSFLILFGAGMLTGVLAFNHFEALVFSILFVLIGGVTKYVDSRKAAKCKQKVGER